MFTFSHTYCNHLCYLTYPILNLLLNEQMSQLIAGVFDTNNILLKLFVTQCVQSISHTTGSGTRQTCIWK